MIRPLAVVLSTLLLAACAGEPVRGSGAGDAQAQRPAARPNVNLSGYNAAFKEGYADGCASAREAERRNASRYGSDTDYTMGWNDGRSMCGRR